MSVFILKLIAMSTMLVDHIAYWFVNNNNVMRNIGRFAFVIYAFLMAESYCHLKDKPDRLRSHAVKLLGLAVLTELPYDQFDHRKWVDFSSQNVIFTLLCGFAALIAMGWWMRRWSSTGNMSDREPEKHTGKNGSLSHAQSGVLKYAGAVCICAAAAVLTYIIKSEYAFRGVLLVVMFYGYLEHCDTMPIWQKLLALLIIDAAYCALGLWTRSGFGGFSAFADSARRLSKWTVGMTLCVVPIAFYNRKLGYRSRWFGWLYNLFYPLQFAVLTAIRYMVRGF